MSGEFEGKAAIVTGAARGIGKAIAAALADRGAGVAVVDIDEESAGRAASEIGENTLAVKCDVGDEASVQQMVEAVAAHFGRIDIAVNNAGICERVRVEDLTVEQWDRTLGINLRGPFMVSKAVLEHMKPLGAGRIINIASIAGKIGGLMVGLHYTASKGGILAVTRGLARELAAYGITVNSVCPAMVDTDMGGLFQGDEKANYLKGVPLKRLATADDVAGAVVYLASDAASYITGEVIDVNGGIVMD